MDATMAADPSANEPVDDDELPPEVDRALAREFLRGLPPEARQVILALLRGTPKDKDFLRSLAGRSTDGRDYMLGNGFISYDLAKVQFDGPGLQERWNRLVAPLIAARSKPITTESRGWPREVLASPLTVALDPKADRTLIVRLPGHPSVDTIVLAPQDANANALSAAIESIWADRRDNGCSADVRKSLAPMAKRREWLAPSWLLEMQETLQSLTSASPRALDGIGTLAAVPLVIHSRRLM
jgi:hypothetical protein